MGAGRQALNVGAPHHVEVWVPTLPATTRSQAVIHSGA
jgi:hypothetical protein